VSKPDKLTILLIVLIGVCVTLCAIAIHQYGKKDIYCHLNEEKTKVTWKYSRPKLVLNPVLSLRFAHRDVAPKAKISFYVWNGKRYKLKLSAVNRDPYDKTLNLPTVKLSENFFVDNEYPKSLKIKTEAVWLENRTISKTSIENLRIKWGSENA